MSPPGTERPSFREFLGTLPSQVESVPEADDLLMFTHLPKQPALVKLEEKGVDGGDGAGNRGTIRRARKPGKRKAEKAAVGPESPTRAVAISETDGPRPGGDPVGGLDVGGRSVGEDHSDDRLARKRRAVTRRNEARKLMDQQPMPELEPDSDSSGISESERGAPGRRLNLERRDTLAASMVVRHHWVCDVCKLREKNAARPPCDLPPFRKRYVGGGQ